jgi:hypothetical protein
MAYPQSTASPQPTTAPTAPSGESELPGANILLIGPAGTGKTHSIGTLVDAGVETFYLSLESGKESLFGYWRDRGKDIPANLHWHDLPAPKASFTELLANAKSINMLSLEALAKQVDPNRGQHNRFITLLEALNNFPDDRTGQKFGAVNTWGPSRALVIDGMTGINNCAMSLVVGGKAVKSQSDWGIAQDQVEKIVRLLCDGCACHLVILAHVEREVDQVLGGTKLMVASLGKALAPKLPPMFSDVILAQRVGADKWVWDTGTPMADVKARNLPFASNLPADFRPLLERWKTRGGKLA